MRHRGAASAVCCPSCRREQLRRVLQVMLDEARVPLALRHSLAVTASRATRRTTWSSTDTSIESTTSPAESTTGLFGGNSNWRGPIWFPVNFLLIESLQKFHHYLGDDFTVECPTGSGSMLTLREVAAELSRRLRATLPARRRRDSGPSTAECAMFDDDPHWRDYSRSTSTFTETPAAASAPATRPAGRRSWPSCCSSPAKTRRETQTS